MKAFSAADRAGAAATAPVLGLAAFVAGLALRPMDETDLFFRLATGARILATGAVPRSNQFSFTHPDHPYLDSAWLFDAGAALLQRAGGFPALVLAKGLLLVLVFTGAFLVCRRRGAGPAAAAGALAAAAWVMAERLVERPHLFSFAGLVALQAVLLAAERRPRWLWLAPAVTAVWANLHAGAFLAPLVLGLHAAGAALDRRASPPPVAPRAVAIAAVASGAALLATPIGPGIFQYLAVHLDIAALHPVDEFRAPSWRWDAPLLGFACATALGLALLRPPPAKWRDILPLVGLALLAARSVRFGAELVLLAAPVLAERLSALASRAGTRGLGRLPPAAAPVAVTAVLLAAALVPRARAAAAGRPALDIDLDRQALPLAALEFVATHDLGARMYNDFELGGYLAFTGRAVFTDPRLPAYPREFHRFMGRADVDRAAWQAFMDRYGVDTALLGDAGINRRLAWWDPDHWALIYRAGDARVFVRRRPERASLIAAREIPATFSFSESHGTRTSALERQPAASPVPGCEWQRRLGDLLFELDTGARPRALAAYERALATPGCLEPARAASARSWVAALRLARQGLSGARARNSPAAR